MCGGGGGEILYILACSKWHAELTSRDVATLLYLSKVQIVVIDLRSCILRVPSIEQENMTFSNTWGKQNTLCNV